MPFYDVACQGCGETREVLARWDAPIWCPCGWWLSAERLLSRPVVRPDLSPYYSDALGVTLQSRAHRREVMRAKSVVEHDKSVVPHGAKGTVFSFPGQVTQSVPPSGAFRRPR